MPDYDYKVPKTRQESKGKGKHGKGKDSGPYSTKHIRIRAALFESKSS